MAEKSVEGAQPSRSQPGKSDAQAQSNETRQQGTEQQGGRQSGGLQRRLASPMMGIGTLGLSPFSLVRRMLEDIDRVFEGFGGARGGGAASGLERSSAGGLGQVWSPAIDIVERD